ncbi:MAG: PAS domain S-box protein, partial [Gemmatimonadaceae bacterium]
MAREVREDSDGATSQSPTGGLALLDAEGVVVFWSATLAAITGIARDAAVGRHISQIYPTDGARDGTAQSHLVMAARHGSVATIGPRRGRAGGWALARSVISAQHDDVDGVRGFRYFVTPLASLGEPATDGAAPRPRRRGLSADAEETAQRAHRVRTLRQSMSSSGATYRRAFDLSPDALLVTDQYGVILEMNTTAMRLFGITEERVPTKPMAVFIAIGARSAFRQLLLRVQREARVESVPLVVLPRSGKETRVRASVALGEIAASYGEIIHWTLKTGPGSDRAASREAGRRQIVQAAEEERARISREIHDVLGQALTALSLEVKALEGELLGSQGAERLRRVRGLVAAVSEQTHEIAQTLRPVALEGLGLERAIRTLAEDWAERTRLAVDFHAHGLDRRLPPAVETTLYRVAQEVLTNAARHAGATRLSVVLECSPWQALMVVDDDGRGFDAAAAERGDGGRLGLIGARERVALIGGTLTVESAPGAGTSVFVRLPLGGENSENGQGR